MKSKNKTCKLLILAIIGVIVISGCIQQSEQEIVTCNSPYIKIGNSCCLDRDSNTICDNDQTASELIDNCIKEHVAGKCSTDSECVGMSETYCGYLLESGCKFGLYGVECS